MSFLLGPVKAQAVNQITGQYRSGASLDSSSKTRAQSWISLYKAKTHLAQAEFLKLGHKAGLREDITGSGSPRLDSQKLEVKSLAGFMFCKGLS